MFRSASDAGRAERPNVVIIMVDDVGWSEIGPYDGEIRTPHLDALARSRLHCTPSHVTRRACRVPACLPAWFTSGRKAIGNSAQLTADWAAARTPKRGCVDRTTSDEPGRGESPDMRGEP